VKTLRRWLRPVRALALRVIEFRRGIMLGMIVPREREAASEAGLHVEQVDCLPADSPVGIEKLVRRQRDGHVLYGIVANDALLTFSWVSSTGATVEVLHAMVLRVPERSIYIWDGFTRPDQRSRGLHQHLLRRIVLQHPDIDTAYVAVDVHNAPSIRALTKAGFQPLFRYYGLKLFNRPVLALARTPRGLAPAQRSFDRIAEEAGHLQA
jgi:GNAT superfamily N-acetyltransferase